MGSAMSSGGGRGCQAVCSPQVRSGLKVTGGALRVGENRSMSSRRVAAWGWWVVGLDDSFRIASEQGMLMGEA